MKKNLWIIIILLTVVIIAAAGYFFLSGVVFQPSETIPVASFTMSPKTVYTGESITFDASASNVTLDSNLEYFWDFGDGNTGTSAIITHAYADNGSFLVSLTITDNDSVVGSSTATKTVLNRQPEALFNKNFTAAKTGEHLQFDASQSIDLDGIIVEYLWDFGMET